MRITKLVALSIVALLVASCVTTQREEREQAIEKAVETPASWAVDIAENAESPTRWLESFNDPMLLKLIEEGKANNIDLQVAAGNMDKAWLLAKQSGAALKPIADLSLGRIQSGSVDGGVSNSNVSVGLQVSWELDVWGAYAQAFMLLKLARKQQKLTIFSHNTL